MIQVWMIRTGVDDSGVDDSGVDDSGVDDSGVDDSGVDDSGVDDSGVDDSGVDDSGVDDSGWDKSLDDPMNKDILLTSFATASDDVTAPPAAATGIDVVDNQISGEDGVVLDGSELQFDPYEVRETYGTEQNKTVKNDPEQVKEDTIPMQKTGIPVLPALLGILSLMGGFIVSRNKQ